MTMQYNLLDFCIMCSMKECRQVSFVYVGYETKQDPVGLLGTETFLCSPFLVCREQTPAPVTFSEFQKADLNNS